MNIVMTGIVTPEEGSPLATAPMRPDREINLAEKYRQGAADTSRLPRMAVYHEGQQIYTAYFPAAGLRHKLRRMARNAVAAAAGRKWDIETHRTLTIGGIKGSGSESGLDLQGNREFRRQYAIQSVFGQSSGMGSSWIAGKLMVGMLVPEKPLEPDIVTGIRSDQLTRSEAEAEFLTKAEYERLSTLANTERQAARLRRMKKKLEKEIRSQRRGGDKDMLAELEAQLEDVEADLEVLEEQLDADISAQMPLSGYEVIPPGMPLKNRIVMRDANAAEFGVLVRALDELALDPQIGAHAAQGCGIIRAEWRVMLDGEDIGVIRIQPFAGLEIEGDDLASLCDQARSAFEKSVKASPLASDGSS